MTPAHDPLGALAARWRASSPAGCPTSTAELEANLLPLVRRVLRGGLTPAAVAGWVRRALPPEQLASPAAEGEAPRLTRLLCAQLLDRCRAAPPAAAETRVGA